MTLYHPSVMAPLKGAREKSRPLRYLILRAHPSRSRADFYNCQELGLAGYLRRQGFQVGVAGVFDDDVRQIDPALQIHQLQFRPSHPAFALITNFASLPVADYDVVQLTDLCLPGNLQVMLQARRGTRFVLYQGHYPEPLGRGRWLRVAQSRVAARALRTRPHALLAKNAAASTFLARCGLGAAPVAGVGLVSENLLSPQPPPLAVTGFLDRSRFTFLYVGRLDRRRPLDWVIPHLRHPALAHASLLVVGGGPALAKLVRDGADLIAAGRLKFMGHLNQSQLGAIYRRADALVLPTRFEIFGMVCLEAMLFGLPLVASDAAGPAVLASRFPERVDLIAGGSNPAGWRDALTKVADPAPARPAHGDPAPELVRALSWEVPGRHFVRAAEQLVVPVSTNGRRARG